MSPDHDPPTAPGRKGMRSLNRAMPLRFAVVLLSMAYTLAAPHLGAQGEHVYAVLGLAAAFLGADTIRPGGMVKDPT